MSRGLTEAQRQILAELGVAGGFGRLTVNLADKLRFGPDRFNGTRWAATRCRTLSKRGLVKRYLSNDQRWYITDAGLAALAMQEGTDAP